MFTRLIEELVGKGLTEKDIGLRVGASQPTINRIKRANKTHQYSVGVAIVELHKRVMEGSLPDTTKTPTGTEQEPGMAFGEFGEPRSGLERREDDRRQSAPVDESV